MNNYLIAVVVFVLCVNIGANIVNQELGFDNSNIATSSTVATDVNIFGFDTNNATNPVQATPINQNQVYWASSLLDLLGLGFITKLFTLISSYLFGFADILRNTVPAMTTTMYYSLKTLLVIVYTFGFIDVFAGSKFNIKG